MGNSHTKLTEEDYEDLLKITRFTQEEINHLYGRFKSMDKYYIGSISYEEFKRIPELIMNPLHERILAMFPLNKDDRIDFRSFVKCLDILANGTEEEKWEFAFKIYDLDCDEYISVDDFSRCLQMMVGDNLNEDAVRKIAEMSVQEADSDGDGKLCEEEFRQAMAGCDINKLLSITVS